MTIWACCRRAAPMKRQSAAGPAPILPASSRGSPVPPMLPCRQRSGRADDAVIISNVKSVEGLVANKEQKRSNREAKKPKQKKKGSDKRPAGKWSAAKV